LVDRILDLVPGKKISAEKVVSPDEDYFRDHFPGFPVVPGVLQTEMMAQAAGKCLDAEDLGRGKAMLARIVSANFRGWVRPGSTCRIFAEVRSSRPKFATVEAWVEVEGSRVADAELLFAFVPMQEFAPGYRDEVLEAYMREKPGNPKLKAQG
jgi:3-hydroxyacyl-[acyl-carrier-protein] dehydratase